MNYAEVLKTLRKQRDDKLQLAAEIHNKAATETRTFNSDEAKAFKDLEDQIAALDLQIKSTEAMERMSAGSAVRLDGGDATNPTPDPANPNPTNPAPTNPPANPTPGSGVVRTGGDIRVVRNLPKGTAFVRYAMALASSKGNLMQAVETAKQWAPSTPEVERVLRAAVAAGSTTDPAWAAPLVEYRNMTEEFIELLRPATILGRIAGVRRVPFNIRIPRQTGGSTVGWVGEAAPKPVSKLAFDTVSMPSSKIAGIVVITNELARYSTPAAEGVVRDDMVAAVAEFTDAQFINPGVAPVVGVSPGSITNGAPAAASAGTTLADIETDLRVARTNFVANRIPLSGAYWIMDPTTRIGLEEMRTAQDIFAYPTLSAGGTLKGLPVIDSLAVGTYDQDGAGVGVSEKFIALVSGPNVMLADDGQVMLDSSDQASLVMDDAPGGGGTLTSLWQRNMIGIRAERFIHWMRRRNNGVFVIYGVEY